MFSTRVLAVVALIGLAGGPVLAQTTVPATPARPALPTPAAKLPAVVPPVAKAPAVQAPAVAATPAPSTTLVNLNTATATQLDALPDVGKARAKAILAERAKGPFKNWSDFDTRMAGSPVNAGVKAKIKDRVTF